MKKQLTKIALLASLVLALVFIFSCSSDDGGGGGGYYPSTATYRGTTSNGDLYSLEITNNSTYEFTWTESGNSSPTKTSIGTVKEVKGNEFTLLPSNAASNETFNVVTNDGGLSAMSGTFTWTDGTKKEGNGTLTPVAPTLPSSSGGGTGPSSCVGGTVKIGSQVWQKCNSDAVPSKGVYKCYKEDQANCQKYGNLYDWEAANNVCPSGFRLPTIEDWEALIDYIETDKGCTDCAAKYLKTSYWYGEDAYDFSALPGGFSFSFGGFSNVGLSGLWWSASESYSNYPYSLIMHYDDVNADYGGAHKDELHSVRCLQGSSLSSSSRQVSSSSSVINSSSSVGGGTGPSSCVGGTVKIGTQTWQKCNSDAVPSKGVSKCYDNLESNCQKYGKLYDWEAANNVCPSGFHLPTEEDWKALTAYIEGKEGCTDCDAKHLKATSGWGVDNTLDSYGFSALPGGTYYNDYFRNVGGTGYWWSTKIIDSDYAYGLLMYYYLDYSESRIGGKDELRSVRCLQN